ncbi:MAG: TSUP family transporter [Erysipelotrichaceae bacterium]|nr:TSUP family transporter [Erysipelotrichaceae bacterium]
MQLKASMFLIICPMLFLAGLVDSIGGGGGLISLPAYILAGLPAHLAIGTNKMSAFPGTALTTFRFAKNRMIDLKLALPSIVTAVIGSAIGARIAMWLGESFIRYMMLIVLPVAALIVLNPKLFNEYGSSEFSHDRKTYLIVCISAFVIGIYDGLYGPGTGTFLIIAFTVFAGMNVTKANGQAKIINLTTNITAFTIYLLNGRTVLPLGLAGALCGMLGNYVGSGLAMKNGSKLTRPVILIVLLILAVRILTD